MRRLKPSRPTLRCLEIRNIGVIAACGVVRISGLRISTSAPHLVARSCGLSRGVALCCGRWSDDAGFRRAPAPSYFAAGRYQGPTGSVRDPQDDHATCRSEHAIASVALAAPRARAAPSLPRGAAFPAAPRPHRRAGGRRVHGLVWQAGEWGRRAALAELHGVAAASLGLHAAALRSDLEKHRAVAFVLARDSDVAALRSGHPDDPSMVDRANRKLEALGEGTRAAAIYVVDQAGLALAASNWRLTTSFVGQDYGFRAYVRRPWPRVPASSSPRARSASAPATTWRGGSRRVRARGRRRRQGRVRRTREGVAAHRRPCTGDGRQRRCPAHRRTGMALLHAATASRSGPRRAARRDAVRDRRAPHALARGPAARCRTRGERRPAPGSRHGGGGGVFPGAVRAGPRDRMAAPQAGTAAAHGRARQELGHDDRLPGGGRDRLGGPPAAPSPQACPAAARGEGPGGELEGGSPSERRSSARAMRCCAARSRSAAGPKPTSAGPRTTSSMPRSSRP